MFNIQNSLNAREVPFYCQNQYGISLNRSCPAFTNPNPLNPYQAISLPQPMNNVQCAIPQFTYNGKAKINANPFIINRNEKKTYVKRKHTNAPRKKFSQEEDEKLKNLVESMGSKKWEQIAKEMPGRTGRQCRDRYQNYLIPGYFNGQWSKMEDDLLLKLFVQYGSQWSKMAQFFSNRSANSLKNRWNYFVSRHMTDFIGINNMQEQKIVNTNESVSQTNDIAENDACEEDIDDQNADAIYENIIGFSNSMEFMYIEPLNGNDEMNNKEEFHDYPFVSNELLID